MPVVLSPTDTAGFVIEDLRTAAEVERVGSKESIRLELCGELRGALSLERSQGRWLRRKSSAASYIPGR